MSAAASTSVGSAALPGQGQGRASVDAAPLATPAKGQLRLQWESFQRQASGRRAFWVLACITVSCVVVPVVLPYSATDTNALTGATAPSLAHPFGTDVLGRDQLARILQAGRISLLIGFVVALATSAIGSVVGVVAGYYGGRVEQLVMSLVDILLTIPPLPLMMALAALASSEHSAVGHALGALPVVARFMLVMVVLGWMGIARIVRSQVISIKQQEYVEAAHAFGASDARIMFVHVLPNTVSSVAIFTAFAVAGAILGEAGLSFLGLGVRPPTATLGNMIGEATSLPIMMNAWWLLVTPMLVLLVIVLCVNFIGEGLRASFERGTR